MPRKQRFKPSRKPKPIPPTEDAMIGRDVSAAPADRDEASPREMSGARDPSPPSESESDQRAR
jgi:hypothetical protein